MYYFLKRKFTLILSYVLIPFQRTSSAVQTFYYCLSFGTLIPFSMYTQHPVFTGYTTVPLT